ncbi:histidine kinase dimerization/phosphoacceptor domain-containing protein [Amycolatopsis sp. NPDC051061]|uniref:sensor histidine kinase n=1 Tax=Amycolatopsis sp. NPDC051061 TaxID=3155042 RepID=UPI003424EFE2
MNHQGLGFIFRNALTGLRAGGQLVRWPVWLVLGRDPRPAADALVEHQDRVEGSAPAGRREGTRRRVRWLAVQAVLGPGVLALTVAMWATAAVVVRLTASRADALQVQTAELRRIERDLHDGAQARLVSAGMLLGLLDVKLDDLPAGRRQLLTEARSEVGEALQELRDLVHGVYPPILADRGLTGGIESLVERSAPVIGSVTALDRGVRRGRSGRAARRARAAPARRGHRRHQAATDLPRRGPATCSRTASATSGSS